MEWKISGFWGVFRSSLLIKSPINGDVGSSKCARFGVTSRRGIELELLSKGEGKDETMSSEVCAIPLVKKKKKTEVEMAHNGFWCFGEPGISTTPSLSYVTSCIRSSLEGATR